MGRTLSKCNDGCTRCTGFPSFYPQIREIQQGFGRRAVRKRRGCRVAWQVCMRVSSERAAVALTLCVALAGCGKSLPRQPTVERGSGPVAAVGVQGAGGLSTKNTTRLGGSGAAVDAAAVALTVYPGLTPADPTARGGAGRWTRLARGAGGLGAGRVPVARTAALQRRAHAARSERAGALEPRSGRGASPARRHPDDPRRRRARHPPATARGTLTAG